MESIIQLFGDKFYDAETFFPLIFRFCINAIFAFIIIERIYYRINKQREFLFTFFIFNILIFFVSSLLSDVKLKTGFAFGLFAIFSILRYRTEQINIKEMTFLFASIIIAVVNSMVTYKTPITEILFANIVITTSIYFLEKLWLKSFNHSMKIVFEDIELINKNKHEDFLNALRKRTGLTVRQYEITKIDYLKDTANLTIYYE